jgi:hypothetical protein
MSRPAPLNQESLPDLPQTSTINSSETGCGALRRFGRLLGMGMRNFGWVAVSGFLGLLFSSVNRTGSLPLQVDLGNSRSGEVSR